MNCILTFVGSNFVIAIAYFSIAAQLVHFLHTHADRLLNKYKLVVCLSVSFILLCGSIYFLTAVQLVYELSNTKMLSVLNVLCAMISITTSIAIYFILPSIIESKTEPRIAELELAQKQIQTAIEHKRDFMAFLCHEIRNPCQIITANSDFLLSTSLSFDQLGYVRAINGAADLLLRIANDVIDITRLRSGKLALEVLPVNLRWLFTSIISTMKPQAAAKDVKLVFQLHDDVPETVLTDPTRMQQLITNLISNAIKFTQQGSIMVVVRCQSPPSFPRSTPTSTKSNSNPSSPLLNNKTRRRSVSSPIGQRRRSLPSIRDDTRIDILRADSHETDGDTETVGLPHHIEIMVIDTGIGMTPDDLKKLFSPFSQAKLSTYREFGGTGLGLSICQNIVHLMNGTVKVHSNPGLGSTFIVNLPMMAVSKEASTSTVPLSRTLSSNPDDTAHSHKLVPLSPPELSPLLPHRHSSTSSSSTSSTVATATATPPPPSYTYATASPIETTRIQPIAGHPNKGECVLVVDDNLTNRKLLHRMISSFGYDVEMAENGVEAIQACTLRKAMFYPRHDDTCSTSSVSDLSPSSSTPSDSHSGEFSCILMDLSMPVMDGFEATTTLRSSGYKGPILALTALAMSESRLKAIECGMQAVLHKPVRHADLRRTLHQYIAGARTTTFTTPSPSASVASSSPTESSPRRRHKHLKKRKSDQLHRAITSVSASPPVTRFAGTRLSNPFAVLDPSSNNEPPDRTNAFSRRHSSTLLCLSQLAIAETKP